MKFYKQQKAAMFGLDARIALAIFGALSVITGAALYKAIQQTKVTSILRELDEIDKAVAQYYLDTGSLLSFYGDGLNLETYDLIDKPAGVTNWKGPYISLEKDGIQGVYSTVDPSVVYGIAYRKTRDWGGPASADMICLQSDASCHVWIGVNNLDLNMIKRIETIKDGTVNPTDTDYTGTVNTNGSWMHYMTNIQFNPKNSPNT